MIDLDNETIEMSKNKNEKANEITNAVANNINKGKD